MPEMQAAGAKQAPCKLETSDEIAGGHPAGAEAHIDSTALAARSKVGDEKANMDSSSPTSENPDMGHPAPVFPSYWVCRRPMETRLKPCAFNAMSFSQRVEPVSLEWRVRERVAEPRIRCLVPPRC